MKKIIIDGAIGWDTKASKIRHEIDSANGDELEINISSPGGSVFDGLEIFNIIRDYSRNQNTVTVKIIGLAASMASYIALSGDKIIAEDNAVFMLHNVWSFVIGDYREMQKEAKEIEKLTNLLAKAYSNKTGKSLIEIREMMNNETWLYGDEMQKAGFVDNMIIVDDEKDKDKDSNLIVAQGRVKNCFAVMEKSEKSKNDIKKAAMILKDIDIDVENSIIENKEQKMEEKKKMDKKELQEKYPELYNEIYNLGAKDSKEKLENIQAHLEFADIAPNDVITAIKNNEEFTRVHSAKYTKVQIMNEMKTKREEDNPEDLNIKPENNAVNEKETSDYTNELKKQWGVK